MIKLLLATLDGDWTDMPIENSGGNGVSIAAEANGLEEVTVSIDDSFTTDEKFFIRLRVTFDQ